MSKPYIKERPILFSAPMVRAILDGTKTQTRRVVKPKYISDRIEIVEWRQQNGLWFGLNGYRTVVSMACPYGQPGDRLWVRETWADLTKTHGHRWERFNSETRLYERGVNPFVWYRADGDQPDIGNGELNPEKWKPSIHMPRWASRIKLEVTGVRVERLQSICEEDAIAEGVEKTIIGDGWRRYCADKELEACGLVPCSTAAGSYSYLWDSINGDGSFMANPWVWVVEFKVLENG